MRGRLTAAAARAAGFAKRQLGFPAPFARAREGVTALEFALLAPMFVTVVAGLAEFGMFIWHKHSIEFAIEETGRSVMTMTTVNETAVSADLKARLQGIDSAAVTATVTQEVAGTTTFVTIQADYNYTFFVGPLLGLGGIAIQSKTRVPLNPPE